MLLVETNIDDMNPELYEYVQQKLFAAGAADVWLQSVQMKKNRPGVLLSALCPPEREDAIAATLLRETSTLGVRVSAVRRHEAAREILEFESSLGPAAVKVKRLPGEAPRVARSTKPAGDWRRRGAWRWRRCTGWSSARRWGASGDPRRNTEQHERMR